MYDTSMMMTFYTLTPTHPGSGTEMGYADLSIQREAHTGFPKVEASTLKGCIREAVRRRSQEEDIINCIFGSPNQGDYASALAITDARLLFFPVKSVIGIFAWVTCPLVIQRFLEDYKVAMGKDFVIKGFETKSGALVSDRTLVRKVNGLDRIMLEDYTFPVTVNDDFERFLSEIQRMLPNSSVIDSRFLNHTVLLGDDDFANFVRNSTEINTRIRINTNTGTVDGNGLFTEEFLPSESIFYAMLFFQDSHVAQNKIEKSQAVGHENIRSQFKRLFAEDMFQIGADTTLGKGMVVKKLWEE